MSNEPVISDQEAMKHYEEIMEKRENGKYDIRSVYSIIVGPSSATTRMHETQHFVNSLVMPEKNDQDFLERGKDEILAYVKTDVKIEDVIKVMHGEMYDYYQKEVNHISERIQRRKNFIKENKDNAPDHAIENSKKNLISNEKRLDDYQKTNLPLRNEYLSTIDGYIRMAYVFKDSGIENRMELLMLTPITQRPKLLEIYNVA